MRSGIDYFIHPFFVRNDKEKSLLLQGKDYAEAACFSPFRHKKAR